MATIHMENRFRTELWSKLSPHTKLSLEVGDLFQVYWKGSHGWNRKFSIKCIEKELIWIKDGINDGGNVKTFRITSVVPAGMWGNEKELGIFIANNQSLDTFNNDLTELLNRDERWNSQSGVTARMVEMADLLALAFVHVVNRESRTNIANILGCRFVIAIKIVDTESKIMKARYAVQGNKD